MNALKCDRCKNYYDYDPTIQYNYISFGHKDIIPSKKITTKDICPKCMDKFIDWLENPFDEEEIKEEEDKLTSLKLCNRENCKGCKEFGWVVEDDDAEAAWGYYTCGMMNKKVKNPCGSAFGAMMLTPKMFHESDVIFREEE
jgi:hypothetical protein